MDPEIFDGRAGDWFEVQKDPGYKDCGEENCEKIGGQGEAFLNSGRQKG